MSEPSARLAHRLFEAARDAMAQAHAPYSRFPVGAAILTDSGALFSGCNIENASYPEGWCAETSAISAMVLAGERRIAEVAVIAKKMDRITPCGGCRQRLREFGAATTKVHLCDAAGVVETVTLGELLPKAFELGEDTGTGPR
jgi:cytidine deaminase